MKEKKKEKTMKEMFKEMLARVDPAVDVDDEEALFRRICDDYEDYARMLEEREAAEREVGSEAPEVLTDGLPTLCGANRTGANRTSSSIFDIAWGDYGG